MKRTNQNLGDICKFIYGKSLPVTSRKTGVVEVYGSNGIVGVHDEPLTPGETLIIGRKGSVGKITWSNRACFPIDTTYYIDASSTDQNLRWLFWYLKFLKLESLNKAAAVPGLNREDAYRLKIFVPPLAEQRRIAEQLDTADRILRLREQAITKLDELAQSVFIEMFGNPVLNDRNINTMAVKQVCKLINGRAFKTTEWCERGMPIIRIQNLNDEIKSFNFTDQVFDTKYLVETGDILFSWSGTPGTSFGCFKWTRERGWLNQHIFKVLLDEKKVLKDFFVMQMNLKIGELIAQAHGGVGLQHVTKGKVDDLSLLIPPITQQKEFCERISAISDARYRNVKFLDLCMSITKSLQHQSFAVN